MRTQRDPGPGPRGVWQPGQKEPASKSRGNRDEPGEARGSGSWQGSLGVLRDLSAPLGALGLRCL